MLAKLHGVKRTKNAESIGKLFAAYVRRADEGALSRILIETVIILMSARSNGLAVLREAAVAYKVDMNAIAAKVKQDFAARQRKRRR